jgi:type VI protein secretion system component Hcp
MSKMLTEAQNHRFSSFSLSGLRIIAAAVLAFLVFAGTAGAQDVGYVRVVGPKGQVQGASTNPMFKDWIAVRAVVSAPSPKDSSADRESSAPSVSELTASPTTSAASGRSGKSTGSAAQSSGMASGKSASGEAATPPRDTATGQTSGKRMHKPFVITKEIDASSPSLRDLATSGEHLAEVDVVFLTNGQPSGKCKLSDAMITSIDAGSAGGNERPTETVTFTYTKIEWTK